MRRFLAILALSALIAAGCGGDDEDDGGGLAGTQTQDQAEAEPTTSATAPPREPDNGEDCVESWNASAHADLKITSSLAGVSSEDTLAGPYSGDGFTVSIDDATDESGEIEVEQGDCVVAQRVGEITRYVFVESGVPGEDPTWHGIPLDGHPLEEPSAALLDGEVRVRVLGSGEDAKLGQPAKLPETPER